MSIAADLFDLTGQVALVTGASSGLGWRFAQVLAGQGAKVVLAARRTDRLEALKQQIVSDGGQAHCAALDVGDVANIEAVFDEARQVFGDVTLLVNNAGISGQKSILETDLEDWKHIREINLDAVWHCSKIMAQGLVKADKGGAIINIASILAFRVARTLGAYAVTKAGVEQMTKAMAIEFARHNIRVNAIAPGYIVTDINRGFLTSPASEKMRKAIPQNRFGDVSDLDGTLLLLASDKASGFMTGSMVVVDGGHSVGLG